MKVGPAGIETISGAMKRPKKQNGHNHGNYLVAVHRTAVSENPNCQRLYSFTSDRYDRYTVGPPAAVGWEVSQVCEASFFCKNAKNLAYVEKKQYFCGGF